MGNSQASHSLLIRIKDLQLLDFAEHSKKFNQAKRKVAKRYGGEPELSDKAKAAIFAGSIATAPLTGLIIVPTGNVAREVYEGKMLKEGAAHPKFHFELILLEKEGKTVVWEHKGIIKNSNYEPTHVNEQLVQLLSVFEQEIKDKLPFFQL